MNGETIAQIVSDFDFLIREKELSPLNEIMSSLNTYLFALTQHGVIDSTEYNAIGQVIGRIVIESTTEKRNVNTEENGEEKC